MHELRTIIAGVDFSPCSTAALRQATRLADDSGARLCVFHAIPKLVITDLAEALGRAADEVEAEVVTDARAQLDALLGPGVDHDRVILEVAVGAPLDEMLEAVRRHRADLLVLGVNGESGRTGGAGTFAAKCVRRAPTKVLLVDEAHSGGYRKIVACIDFSETSRRALEQAIHMARCNQAELTAVHVYSAPWHKLHYRAPTPEASPAFQRQYLDRLQGLLDGFVAPLASEVEGVSCRTQLHEHPSYGRGIVEYLRANDSDLVVLGTEGNPNLRYMLLGSTAERVLRETPCSTLTIKPLECSQPEG